MSQPATYGSGALDRLEVALRADGAGAAAPATAPPTAIGRYDVLELIGQGGMGEVYRAEQRTPVRRTVALKLIKLGMDSREVVRRFEGERQALAWMDHPNVARVLDAGTDPVSGRPYFVMEYVSGLPITRYCDERRLTVRERLELFAQVCDAVAHAHQKMVVHRDLKPSNILVAHADDAPRAKVIDFGVAKALVAPAGDRTAMTELGQVIGTPEYMSPEQACAGGGPGDVDTSTDVYALGVVLYELLAGALPFDPVTLRASGQAGIERTLRDIDPPRPSTRLSGLGDVEAAEVAARRRARPAELVRQLKSELEWIPLKAMRKDRAQRYATVTELGQDVENYLEHRPLVAGPESPLYRLRKFARRRRLPLASAAAIVLLLAGATAMYVRGIRTEQARTLSALHDARLARADTEAVNRFLIEDLLNSARPGVSRGRDLSIREVLDIAAQSVSKRFQNRSPQEVAVRRALAIIYRSIGRSDLGLPQAELALQRARESFGEDHLSTLEAMDTLALLLGEQGRMTEVAAIVRDLLERSRRVLGDDHPLTLQAIHQMGFLLWDLESPAASEPYRREALERRRRVLGDDDSDTLSSILNLGALYRHQGRLTEAEALLSEATERARRTLDEEHPFAQMCGNQLAMLYAAQGRHAEAEHLFLDVLRVRQAILGPQHPHTRMTIRLLAKLYDTTGRPQEAERWRAELPRGSPTTGPAAPPTPDEE